MDYTTNKLKPSAWFFFVGLVISLGLLLTACSANEQVVYGDSVAEGTTIRNNLILTGEDVKVEGDVHGDVFVAGRTVTVDGNIGGNLYLIGETAAINGAVDGNIYSAGIDLSLGPDSSVGKSLFFVGAGLNTERGSTIGWDLFTVSLGATLAGDVSGETRAVIGPVELLNIIFEQLGTRFDLPNLPRLFPSRQSRLPQTSGFLANLGVQASTLTEPTKLAGVHLQLLAQTGQTSTIDAQAVLDQLVPRLKNFVFLLILGGLAIWLIPKRFLSWTNEARSHPYASTGYGFVIAIVGYVGSGIVAAMLLAITIGVVIAGFWEQALLFSLFSLSGLGLIFSIFLIFVYYGSKIIVSYLIGWLIINRLSPASTRYRMLSLILGLLIYEILRSIPYLGFVFAAIVTFLGLGAAWMALIKMRRGEVTDNPLLAEPADSTQDTPASGPQPAILEAESDAQAGPIEMTSVEAPEPEETEETATTEQAEEEPKPKSGNKP